MQVTQLFSQKWVLLFIGLANSFFSSGAVFAQTA